ncbi:hypothetical protein KIN_10050 [Litoreibacter roseus]|uniref:Uncharacterized protein n=1 Tax=Litoreibacter roseus TaxID=2601869 RepID=A0A6N6JC89_9RHOB|nr:hypothetical protein KIN_10050 [Litoreibacter roseus]
MPQCGTAKLRKKKRNKRLDRATVVAASVMFYLIALGLMGSGLFLSLKTSRKRSAWLCLMLGAGLILYGFSRGLWQYQI